MSYNFSEEFDGCINYEDSDNAIHKDFVVVQFDSLYRVVFNYDVVILDEIHGLTDSMFNPTNKRRNDDIAMFKKLIKYSSNVIVADADLTCIKI